MTAMSLYLFVCVAVCVSVCLVASEPPISRRPITFRGNWPSPLKSAKQVSGGVGRNAKQKTFVVQIRSDDPVPLVLKGRPGAAHLHRAPAHVRGLVHHHPIKLNAPLTHQHHPHLQHHHQIKHYNAQPLLAKQLLRKPLKLKLNDPLGKFKLNSISGGSSNNKPATTYGLPFKYEKPTTVAYTELQKLPFETHANFLTDHYTPLHTIPAPNLGLHDNHLSSSPDDSYLPPPASFAEDISPRPSQSQSPQSPQPTSYHTHHHHHQHVHSNSNNNQYEVNEEHTNDQTVIDPLSGTQTLFAPDPDPSLPTSKIRPAIEAYNRPSNGQSLPLDVETNLLLPAQPLVQIVGAQALAQTAVAAHVPEIYPVQAQLQPAAIVAGGPNAGLTSIAAAAAAAVPIYNPTYLVTQSNNLYTQHQQQQQQQQQQLHEQQQQHHVFQFQPTAEVIAAGYGHADLTQHVANDGQILQAGQTTVLDSAPQFAALIAAPALEHEQQQQLHQQHYETASFRLPNVGAASSEGGFVVSNYYSNPQDSSQLLHAYAEEESQRQQLEAQHASIELQRHQQHQHEEQLRHEQAVHLAQQVAQQQQVANHQQQAVQHLQQHPAGHQQAQLISQQPPATYSAFEEHQRLVQQQLGADTPLRIFVPDDEGTGRLQKRADNLDIDDDESFHVSTSVEVSNERQDEDDEVNS